MLYRLLVKARYLTVVPVLGLLAACSSLFVMGSKLILQQLWVALQIPKEQLIDNPLLPTFEVESLQGINLLLVGTGCLTLALGMFSLFVRPLRLPPSFRVGNFHELKGQFANYVILAMAISFLENLAHLRTMIADTNSNGSELFFAGAGMALVTFALLAFKYWGGEPKEATESEEEFYRERN